MEAVIGTTFDNRLCTTCQADLVGAVTAATEGGTIGVDNIEVENFDAAIDLKPVTGKLLTVKSSYFIVNCVS